MKSAKLRQLFLSYFENQEHHIVDSSPLVPGNDPTLLFTNAGMVQFKETFLGQEQRNYTRAVSSQRCVRAGGKHNDLENVGYTARHHTFFEMLGNFSFGDYSKREAIKFAWKFLTNELKLAPEKLWVTVFEDDDEAANIWLNEMGISKERFSRCGAKDNFWSMGDTGPCGPCSEIFYDHGEHIWGGPPGTPEEDGDRYVEIWNLVFMQYNRDVSGDLTPLPKPSVDTGMGLERIAAVMQGVNNNYDIDIFQTLINDLFSLTEGQDKNNASFKVIVDHIRSCSFMILDGVLPGNEGRGYVLRRIIRRAIRHGHKLGLTSEPFFYKLVSSLVKAMGEAYGQLIEQQSYLEKVLKQEEEQFSRTLNHGLHLLEADISKLKGDTISGATLFKLFDTYGFPFDLTADIARERNLKVDKDGFEKAMEQRREESRSSSTFKIDLSDDLQLNFKTKFIGYEHEKSPATIVGLLNNKSELTDSLGAADEIVGVVLDKTPFYVESGGQASDYGILVSDDIEFSVNELHRQGEAIVHYGKLNKGKLFLNLKLDAKVSHSRRSAIKINHSATHLAHAALKKVLGNHVQQKGSLVNNDKARFDFSHYQAMSKNELEAVEILVNEQIRINYDVLTEEMNFEDAKTSGAIALFGEKYSEKVRVLSMGDFSKELCGGTHAKRTGDIGLFKIISETGIASGVRRIEFVTGAFAHQYVLKQEELLYSLSNKFHTSVPKLLDKVDGLLQHQKSLEKELEILKAKAASASGNKLLDQIESIGDYSLLLARLDNCEPKSLRTTLDGIKDKMQRAAIVLVAVNGNKMNVVAGLTKDAVGKMPDAKVMVQKICGKGGGRVDMAQGGGLLPPDLEDKFKEIKAEIVEKLGIE